MTKFLKEKNVMVISNGFSYKVKICIGVILISLALVFLNVCGVMAANDNLGGHKTEGVTLNDNQLASLLKSASYAQKNASGSTADSATPAKKADEADQADPATDSATEEADATNTNTDINKETSKTADEESALTATPKNTNQPAPAPKLGADAEVAFHSYWNKIATSNETVDNLLLDMPVYTVCVNDQEAGGGHYIKPYLKKDVYRDVTENNMADHDNNNRLFMKSYFDLKYFAGSYCSNESDRVLHSYSLASAMLCLDTTAENPGPDNYVNFSKFTVRGNDQNSLYLCYCDEFNNGASKHTDWDTNNMKKLVNGKAAITLVYKDLTDTQDHKHPEIGNRSYYDFEINYQNNSGAQVDGKILGQYYFYDQVYDDSITSGDKDLAKLYLRMLSPFSGNITLTNGIPFPVQSLGGKALYQKMPDRSEYVDPDKDDKDEFKSCVWTENCHYGIPNKRDDGFEDYPLWNNDDNVSTIEKREDGSWRYLKKGNAYTWYNITFNGQAYKGDLYLSWVYTYGRNPFNEQLNHVVPSVDSSKHGVNISLFDYDSFHVGDNGSWGGSYNDYGINKGNKFKFSRGSNNQTNGGWNHYTGGKNIWPNGISNPRSFGVWEYKLSTDESSEKSNRYLWLNKANCDGGQSLQYLFQTQKDNPGTGYVSAYNPLKYVRSYSNLNGLFSQEVYDRTGYFCYGSSAINGIDNQGHHAQLTARDDVSKNHGASNDLYSNMDIVLNYNQYQALGAGGDDDGKPYFMPFDDYFCEQSDRDYHFGMHVEASFVVPQGAFVKSYNKLEDKDASGPMVYHFNGDDDMAFYINAPVSGSTANAVETQSCCLLNLGGIHQQITGDVNFTSGIIKYQDGSDQFQTVWLDDMWKTSGGTDPASLTNTFQKMTQEEVSKAYGVEGRPASIDENMWNNITNHYRFKDYVNLSFDMFYLERGGQASNLEFAFNFETFNPGDLNVQKNEIVFDEDVKNPVLAENSEEFYYKVEVSHKGEGGVYTPYKPYCDTTAKYFYGDEFALPVKYDVYKADRPDRDPDPVAILENQKPNEYGCIKLKADQRATLHGFGDGDKFRIGECDPGGLMETTPGAEKGDYAGFYQKEIIEALYHVEVYEPFNTTVYPSGYKVADRITMGDDTEITWRGVNDLIVGMTGMANVNNTVIFQNTAKNLFDLKVLKRGYNNAESKFKIYFDETDPDSGADIGKAKIFDYTIYTNGDPGEKQTCPIAGVNASTITLKDGQYAMIHDVQMGVKTRIVPVLLDDTITSYGYIPMDVDDWDYYFVDYKGDFVTHSLRTIEVSPALGEPDSDQYQWSVQNGGASSSQMIRTQIPCIWYENLPNNDKDRYAQIDFIVDLNTQDLVITKKVNDGATSAQKSALYPLSAIIYDDDEPYTTESSFDATITYADGSEYTSKVWISDCGEILFEYVSYLAIPSLKDGDKLTVKSIIKPGVFKIAAYEHNCNGLWYPHALFNGDKLFDMELPYVWKYGFSDDPTGKASPAVPAIEGTNTIEITNEFLGTDLIIGKIVSGGNTNQQNALYPLSILMYKDVDGTEVYDGSEGTSKVKDKSPIYSAKYRQNQDSPEKTTEAIIGENGQVLISDFPNWVIPSLGNSGYLIIEQIVPTQIDIYMRAYEENCDPDYWNPYAQFNTATKYYLSKDFEEITGVLKDGKVNEVAQKAVKTGSNSVAIYNNFESNSIQIAKIVGNGTPTQNSAKYNVNVLLFTNENCTAAFAKEDEDYTFDATLFKVDPTSTTVPPAYSQSPYKVKIASDVVLGKTCGLLEFAPVDESGNVGGYDEVIELGNGDYIIVDKLIPNTKPIYMKAIEAKGEVNHNFDFWRPYVLYNSDEVEKSVMLKDLEEGTLPFVVDMSDKGAPSIQNAMNSVLFENDYESNDLILGKSVNGGTLDDASRAYDVNVLLSKTALTGSSGSPINTDDPTIEWFHCNETYLSAIYNVEKHSGQSITNYWGKVTSKGELLIKPVDDSSDWATPRLIGSEYIIVQHLLPAFNANFNPNPTQVYVIAYETKIPGEIGSDPIDDKCIKTAKIRNKFDEEDSPTGIVTSALQKQHKLSTEVKDLQDDGWANLETDAFAISRTLGNICTVEVVNNFGGNDLRLQKIVRNGSPAQQSYEYPVNVALFADAEGTTPYTPDPFETEYIGALANPSDETRNKVLTCKLAKKTFTLDGGVSTIEETLVYVKDATEGSDDEYHIPKLRSGEILFVSQLIPERSSAAPDTPVCYLRAWELGTEDDIADLVRTAYVNVQDTPAALGLHYTSTEEGLLSHYETATPAADIQGESNYVQIINTYPKSDLTIKKTVSGNQPDEVVNQKSYAISVLFLDIKTGKAVVGSSLGTFEATAYKDDTESDETKIGSYTARITDTGELVFFDKSESSTSRDSYGTSNYIFLKNKEHVKIEKIIPDGGNDAAWGIKAFEADSDGIVKSKVKINNGGDSLDISTPYPMIAQLPQPVIKIISHSKGLTNQNYVNSVNGVTNTIEISNEYEVITGFDVLKNPLLMVLLALSLMALISIIPAKLLLKKMNTGVAGKHVFIDSKTGLFTEDFDV